MTLPEHSPVSPFVRDALAVVHQQSLELIVRGASLDAVLEALCDGIDALDPNVVSSVLLADPEGQRLWPKAGRRVPEDYKQLMTPLPIAPSMGACGTAAFRKQRVISADIATDPLWSGPVEHCRRVALQHGFRAAWSVPIVSDTGELLGTFGLHHTQSKSVSTQDIELLEQAGQIALIAIERTRAQEALTDALAELKKSEGELRTIIDMIPQMIAVLAPDGHALYVNDLTLEYTGLSGDEARGAEFRRRVFHPEDLERLQDERHSALSRGVPFENEQRARRHDGHYRWFLIRYRPMRDGHGHVVRWYATATDIDDRKHAEDRTRNENLALREEIDRSSMFEEIVGSSAPLRRVLTLVEKVAATDSTVLILGETGCGKELIARAIHKKSHRAARAFIRVNCAAIPPSLVASELFGHEKGAFTGALQRRLGRFESANAGTIFLDEIGDLPAETQISLLRVLQDREIERLGNSHSIPVDVRVLAATNRDLENGVAGGTFRQDLFYRLNVFPIRVPSLRERADDIPLLVEYLIERYATKAGKRIRRISRSTLTLFQAYDWPGNIRELQNVIERAVILCDGDTFSVDETWLTRDSRAAAGPSISIGTSLPQHQHLQSETERQMIEAALAVTRGRIAGAKGAAAKLGIPRQTLDSKISALGIDKHRFKSR
ncbi:MAG TPA: sigma 54-interacting transcriptional regulator [Vicinamibacterales bacterium]|nr:sigma 54-interacting transcriptional regulator [Vicinamibacterales bacterium]